MDTEVLPTWDLSPLYNAITDAKIKEDIALIQGGVRVFETMYRGKITSTTTAEDLASALKEYASLIQGMQKIEAYAYLDHSTHTGDEVHGAFFQNISTSVSNLRSHILFFETSLIEIPAPKLEALVTSKPLTPYKHFLEKKIAEKKHRLPEVAENVMLQKSLTGRHAFIRLQDQHLTAQKTLVNIEGKNKHLTVSGLMNLLYSPDRALREQSSKKIAVIAKRTLTQSTFTYNTLMQDFSIDASLRSFEKSEDMRHLENEVDRTSVTALSEVVTSSYPIVHEYYQFKEKILNIGPLYEYDRYAPISAEKKHYSFAYAQETVLEAFHAFSPEYGDVANTFFKKRWIDTPSTNQKRNGAFCMYCTPDTNPYILLNYHGGARDVSTLAHELGHGIHAYLARGQSILQFDWPITIAETASIFGEMVLFKHMLEKTSDKKEKLALTMAKIEEIFASTFRQIAMYEFEKEAHELRSTQGELTSKQLNALWKKQQRQMFGDALYITDSEAPYWSLIPHLFHTPFYVYSYAFGELLTLSLFSLYEKSPEGFAEKYMNFLRAGGSKSPQELLSVFNVDIHQKSFWEQGITEISSLLTIARTYI